MMGNGGGGGWGRAGEADGFNLLRMYSRYTGNLLGNLGSGPCRSDSLYVKLHHRVSR